MMEAPDVLRPHRSSPRHCGSAQMRNCGFAQLRNCATLPHRRLPRHGGRRHDPLDSAGGRQRLRRDGSALPRKGHSGGLRHAGNPHRGRLDRRRVVDRDHAALVDRLARRLDRPRPRRALLRQRAAGPRHHGFHEGDGNQPRRRAAGAAPRGEGEEPGRRAAPLARRRHRRRHPRQGEHHPAGLLRHDAFRQAGARRTGRRSLHGDDGPGDLRTSGPSVSGGVPRNGTDMGARGDAEAERPRRSNRHANHRPVVAPRRSLPRRHGDVGVLSPVLHLHARRAARRHAHRRCRVAPAEIGDGFRHQLRRAGVRLHHLLDGSQSHSAGADRDDVDDKRDALRQLRRGLHRVAHPETHVDLASPQVAVGRLGDGAEGLPDQLGDQFEHLPADSASTAAVPAGPGRHATELRDADSTAAGPVPARSGRHPAELCDADDAPAMPAGSGRDAAQLCDADDAPAMPAGPGRDAAQLHDANDATVPAGAGRHPAELHDADSTAAGPMPCRTDRNAAELCDADDAPAMPAGPGRDATELCDADDAPAMPAGPGRDATELCDADDAPAMPAGPGGDAAQLCDADSAAVPAGPGGDATELHDSGSTKATEKVRRSRQGRRLSQRQ